MNSYINPSRELWEEICRRPSEENATVRTRVEKILARVKEEGDEAPGDRRSDRERAAADRERGEKGA